MPHRHNPLLNKIAIIIGSAQGVGVEIARQLGHAGAQVVIQHLPEQRQAAQKVEEEIFACGGRAWAVPADPRKESDVGFLLEQTVQGFGEPDIIVIADSKADNTLSNHLGLYADQLWRVPAESGAQQEEGFFEQLALDERIALRRLLNAAVAITQLQSKKENAHVASRDTSRLSEENPLHQHDHALALIH